ncbi:MAG TPA: transketolase C-terminal domain-containing protein [Gaiellaceae bacterium]|nr:transketolase C-terminal domain-containing protein [Gaiellaceae bacterium]
MAELALVPQSVFARLREEGLDDDRLATIADLCRLNALTAVKRAGSGHLGSSFSAMDIVVYLLYERLNTVGLGFEHPDRDVYFSSKGHDVPGLYAVLHSLGVVPTERLVRLRRHGGLDGHPNVRAPGIEANSGSLGMGISKGRGIAWAKRLLGREGRVVVMVGDGELQEGQNFEALQGAAHDRLSGLTVVVDRNELQSDRPTEEILALGDLEAKLAAFGWHVLSCDGHDFAELRRAFDGLWKIEDRPQALVARTIKGRGVSFMEHPAALREGGGTYRWHAGAPDDESFVRARDELLGRTGPVELEPVPPLEEELAAPALEAEPTSGAGMRARTTREYVVQAYGEALVELAGRHPELVVLDADLASDCRVRGFEEAYPDRFVECGIAEQDMVSVAGGLARHGLLPVVNSFASFLASRANEQIYNAASEGSKVIYGLHYAGLVPAGPGMSHQSLRDISLLAALPNITIVQPANAEETRALLTWAVEEAKQNVAMRLAIGPSPRRIDLPAGYEVHPGRGAVLRDGLDALVLAYGPVMLHEVLTAAELLAEDGIGVAVVGMPWLNRVDREWLDGLVGGGRPVIVVEDHAPVGGLGDTLRRELPGQQVTVLGVDGWPAFGTPPEALRFHGLDGLSLAGRIAEARSLTRT